MKIIDENGAAIENPDLTLGYLVDDTEPVEHPAVEGVEEVRETDETTQKFLAVHGRAADYKKLAPADLAYYDGVVEPESRTRQTQIRRELRCCL